MKLANTVEPKQPDNRSLTTTVPLLRSITKLNRVAKDCGLQEIDYPSVRLCRDLKKCLAACGGLVAWDEALEEIRTSPFLQGKKGWQVTLGWLIKPGNFSKVIKRNYRQDDLSHRSGSLAEIVDRQLAKMSGSRADE